MDAIIIDFQNINTPDVSEITTLAQDLGYNIVKTLHFKSHNKPFLGKGQLQEIAKYCKSNKPKRDHQDNTRRASDHKKIEDINDHSALSQEDESSEQELYRADVVIYNGFLSGLKIKVMEKYIKAKILSRIDIIIEVFESRASTPESKLQIKLAKLLHQRAKLVRMWSHLERQRAHGVMGGPGEKQIELDRRMIHDQILFIKKQLQKVESSRAVRAVSRQDPIVALVGFANAGKSSLFNRLTGQHADISPKAFTTLDALMRSTLILGNKVVITDTVGFVSHLPPFLVKAFRATLDHIAQADVIICVHDAVNLDNSNQVLEYLEKYNDKAILQVVNKTDLHMPDPLPGLPISVKTGFNIDKLEELIAEQLDNSQIILNLSYSQGNVLQWIIKHSMKYTLDSNEDSQTVTAILSRANKRRLDKIIDQS